MKPIALLSLFFMSTQVYAAKDTVHCTDALNRFHPNSGYDKVWAMDDNGKVQMVDKRKGIAENLGIQARQTGDEIEVTDSYLSGRKVTTKIKTDHGVLSKVTTVDRREYNEIFNSQTTFEMQDTTCVPKELEVRENDRPNKKTIPKLCDELRKYISKNPKAVSCDCGDKATSKAMADIMSSYGVSSTELKDRSKSIFTTPKKENAFGWEPKDSLYVAVSMITECNAAFPRLMRDDKIWNPAPAASTDSSDKGNGDATKEPKKD
ncbi:MAG: hypothetical protein ACXVA9_04775 [Bdellovibrionales bacterium]